MRWRPYLVLAMVTVLWGAPSTVSAAGGNTLSAAEATPTTGTTQTLFTLRVSYAGAPAISVSATVAGRTLPLLLASGSTSQGTWSVSALLPQGSWSTTFVADASQGRDPSLSGPTITVGASATPTLPLATIAPIGGSKPDVEEDGGFDGPAPSPTDAPAAPAPTEPPSGDDGPSATSQTAPAPGDGDSGPAAPVATDGAAPGDAPSQTASGAGSVQAGPSSQPAADGGAAPTPDVAPGATQAGSASRAQSGGADPATGASLEDAGHGPDMLAIGAGIGVVLAFALLGWFGLLFGRRRRAAAPGGAAADPPDRRSLGEDVDAALLRRTLRRAKVRLDGEDPILTSVGVGTTAPDDPHTPGPRRRRRRPPPA
ncbi:MAG TPA: hypothetical protein VF364_00375 [Candidatus Limnocylindria bacterium]